MVRRFLLALVSVLAVLCLAGPASAAPGFPGASLAVANQPATSPQALSAGLVAHAAIAQTNIVQGNFGTSLDFGWGAPSCSTFDANGANGGISYISHDGSKDFTGSDIARLHSCGKVTAVVFETTTTRSTDGYQAGIDDARYSQQRLRDLGAPSYVVVYFATDQDTSGGAVNDYYRGAASVLGYDHTGIYAGIGPVRDLVCSWHTVKYGWQTIAWSAGQLADCGSAGPGVVALYQRAVGNSVDWNTELTPFWGQWPANVGPVVPPDPRHFRLYATSNKGLRGLHGGPFWTRHGYRDERLEIQRYIGSRKHKKLASYTRAVEQECWDLAGRIVVLHEQGRLPYSKFGSGFRQFHLRECAEGKGISA